MKKTISLLTALCLLLALFCTTAAADDVNYRVQVLNNNGETVQGVMMQFCSDTECMMAKTDASGIAEFAVEAGSYSVHILKVPDGYLPDGTEYTAPETPGQVTLVLYTAEDEQDALSRLVSGDITVYDITNPHGNPVNSADILAGAKVTMINLWATRCSSCETELPELTKMAEVFAAQGGQIIGICHDAPEEGKLDLARSILEESGVTYLNLVLSEDVNDIFPATSFPVTYFIDSEGKLLADPVRGAYPDTYRGVFAECIAAVG